MTSSLPRTYVAAGGWRLFLLIVGAALLVGGLAGTWNPSAESAPGAALLLQGISLALAILGATCVAYAVRYRVVLYPHSLEVHGLFKARSLRRDGIAAYRTIQIPNAPPTIEFIPKDASTRPLQVSQIIRIDKTFRSWLDDIPDQCALDQQRFEEEVEANRLLGKTPQQRRIQLKRLHRQTRYLTIASGALAFWGLLNPRPYEIVMGALIVLPAVAFAIAASSKGLIQVNQLVRDKRPSIDSALIGPGIVLALRAFLDFHILDWPLALGMALAGGALIALGISRWGVATRKWSAVLLMGFLFCFPYAYGTVVELNFLLGGTAPQQFETIVTGKHQTSDKHKSWDLTVGPWGPAHDAEDVSVDKLLYESVAVGDTVCVFLFQGALGMNWILVSSCLQSM